MSSPVSRSSSPKSLNGELSRLSLSSGGRSRSANFTCWRSSLPLPTDKLGFILENDLFTDLTFAAGESGERISAHKLILAMSSPVFEAMLLGPLAASPGEIITIPDVDPVAFRLLLKFVYTGKFTATIQNAVNLMYAAKKYDLVQLTLKCSELLRSDLTETNAVTILQAAQLLDDTDLERKAEIYLVNNFEKVIEEEDFLTMSQANLCRFLDKDELDVMELELFEAVLSWATAECHRREIENVNNHQQRMILEDIIKLVRFPLMTPEEFSLNVIPLGILSSEEALSILQYLSVSIEKRNRLPELMFCTQARNTCNIYKAHFATRLTDMTYPYVSHISYFDSFEVDQPISIVSVGFPGPDIDNAAYDVAVQIQEQGTNLMTAQTNQSVVCKRRSVMIIRFDKPVRIEPNKPYKVVYKLKGPDTFYADQRIERFPVTNRSSKSKTEEHIFSYHSRNDIHLLKGLSYHELRENGI